MIVTTVLSFAFPQNFDWDVMRTGIRMIEMDGTDALATSGEDSAEALEGALKCAPLMFSYTLNVFERQRFVLQFHVQSAVSAAAAA